MGTVSNRGRVRHTLRRSGILVIALFALTSIVDVARAQSGGDSGEADAIMRQYIAAWNTHDAGVLAAYFAADADMIMGTGTILRGRAAIQGWWRDYFAAQEPERTLTIEVLSSMAITKDVDLINVRTTTGGTTVPGGKLSSRKARGTWVVVRREGAWSIAAMRGMPTEQDRIIRRKE